MPRREKRPPPPERTPEPPPDVPLPPLPRGEVEATPGRFLLTCRAGFEGSLFEELTWQRLEPRLVGPALVEAQKPPPLEPVFGRAGFLVEGTLSGAQESWASKLGRAFAHLSAGRPLHLQVWTPDTDAGNRLAADAEALRLSILDKVPPAALATTAALARERNGKLGQVCLVSPTRAIWGWVPAVSALSLAPGGRQRMRREEDDASRSALKLEEALEMFGIAPGPGELCVDLGAAPGGWTQRLLQRRARVVAVDPAALKPDVARLPKLRHERQSAFKYEPAEPADWLFCDMAWRPLEVAQLLSKWGRRGAATYLVANIKLPMKDKNHWIWRIRDVLEHEGGWRHMRVRQLYHDRDEVTVIARHTRD